MTYFDRDAYHGPDVLNYTPSVHRSIMWSMLGNKLGSGIHRDVYASRLSRDHVIKVEPNVGSFANVMEWEIWRMVEHHENAKWFAPVFGIDPFGTVLIQARTKRVTPSQFEKVKELPAFFWDVKPENFGWYKGRIVCHDYAITSLIATGVCSKKMKKNAWS